MLSPQPQKGPPRAGFSMGYFWHFRLVPTAPSQLWKTKMSPHMAKYSRGEEERRQNHPYPHPHWNQATREKISTTCLSVFHNRLQTETSPGKLLNLESLITLLHTLLYSRSEPNELRAFVPKHNRIPQLRAFVHTGLYPEYLLSPAFVPVNRRWSCRTAFRLRCVSH